MVLSDNQERLLSAVRAAADRLPVGGCATTEELGRVHDRTRAPIGADAARKVMGRLEKRSLVSGAGSGAQRTWRLTGAGLELIDDVRPPKSGAQSGDTVGRGYTVLEELTLSDLLDRRSEQGSVDSDVLVYVVAGTVDARNTEHAYRQIAKQVYAPRQHLDGVVTIRSVAIDGKRWKVTPVNVKADTTVTIG